ncbi:MAG: L,D-transpeptidase family protein [Allosphingosinicella sp.]
MRFHAALAVLILPVVTVSAAAPGAPLATEAVVSATLAPTFAVSDAPVMPTAAPLAPAPVPVVVEAPVAPVSLEPGEFVWHPERSTTGPVEIVVSIPLQRAYVYRGGALIGETTVSTGRPGHATPTGRFPILEKRREHYSNLYNNAPMPFMQRLTWGGIALHAGHIPGRPASHGCVRLPLDFARQLFTVTQSGTTVHIIDSSPSAEVALAVVRGEPVRGTVTTLAMNGTLR